MKDTDMIGYVTLGSDDPAETARFLGPILEGLGGRIAYELEQMIAWGFGDKRPLVMVTRPHDGGPASTGNGSMIALLAPDRAAVDRLHALALATGGTDEGAPGPRGTGFYAAYFRSPEGHKFALVKMG